MADDYTTITSDDPRSGLLTYPQLQARRAIAVALATRNRPYPKTIGEGLTALGEGLGEGYYNRNLELSETAQQARDAAAGRRLEDPTASPPSPGKVSLEGSDPAAQSYAMVPPDATETKQPLTVAQASQQPQMPVDEVLQRLKRNDSGSEKDPYRKIGQPNRRGDYPYGAYEIMGEDIPAWTKKHLGREMTPQEFLADDKAQDQVARGQASEYLAKYGPNGTAAAWAVGEKDMNDTSRPALQAYVNEYVKRFNIPLVNRDQITASAAGGERPIQVASLGGMPTPDTAPDPREAVTQTLTGPPPQQVAQAAPIPTAPPSPVTQPRSQIAPSTAATMEERPTPAGPKPRLEDYLNDPRIKPLIDEARRQRDNPALSPMANAKADARFKELHEIAKTNYTSDFTVWHERNAKEDAYRTDREVRQRAREKHDVEMTEAPYKLEQARKAAEPTVREVDGRILERVDGKWSDVTPGGYMPKLDDKDKQILGFYERAKWALHNLGDGKELTDFWKWHASGMPLVGNYATNAKFQRQLNAANEIAAVQLRLETGTAAPPAELKNVIDRFVPSPGDQPELTLQKTQQRGVLLKSYVDQLGSKGQPYVEKFNREFELDKQEYDKKHNAMLPPIKITDESQLELLPPGRRWVAPDGKIKIKP